MAGIDITSAGSTPLNDGILQLETGVPMDSTLRNVADQNDTTSPLKLSTTAVQVVSPLRITTDDPSDFYLDCEDGATNNRFSITRNTASQQVNLNFSSNPAGSTTQVGAIRTFTDGVNLGEVVKFREDGQVTFTERVNVEADSLVTTQSSSVIAASTTNANLVIAPNGTGALVAQIPDGTIAGGNARGIYAVDLQMGRNAIENVASGNNATIGGGYSNKASGTTAPTVAGGQYNFATGLTVPTIGGGSSNVASSSYSTISGGLSNTASSTYSVVSGGQSNTASTNTHATVVGGQSNTSSGQHSISGGISNTASGQFNVALGNTNNTAGIGAYALGSSNTVNANGSTENSFAIGESNNMTASRGVYSFGRANTISNGKYSFIVGQSNTISASLGENTIFGFSNTISGTSLRGYAIGYSNTITGGTNNFAIGNANSMGSGTGNKALADSTEWLSGDYTTSIGISPNPYLRNQFIHGAVGGTPTRGRTQVSNLIAYNDGVLTTGGTTVLSLDGTGVTNLIIPYGNNRMWNVQVRWVAVVTAITGTATGVTVGDTKTSTDLLAVAKRVGVTTVSAHTSAGTHAIETIAGSLTAANIAYTAGASQEMAITFTGPTFAGGGSVTMRVVAAISLTEVAY